MLILFNYLGMNETLNLLISCLEYLLRGITKVAVYVLLFFLLGNVCD